MAPKKKEEDTGPSLAARFGRVKSNLKMGIVGLPNVGKSSLFNLLTQQAVAAENYPFCTIEPTDARCSVPDARYDDLISVWKPKSEYPAYLWCTDIAGLVRGASEGAGLGNAFLSHIQAAAAAAAAAAAVVVVVVVVVIVVVVVVVMDLSSIV